VGRYPAKGVVWGEVASIELVLLPTRGEVGTEDIRFGIFGGDEGEVADTKEDELAALVVIDDVLV
jgi:hypothetical protein